jgi:hypothetical protein
MTESQKLDLEKQRLECEKLRLEVAQINIAWWKRPVYIGSLVPMVLAFIGLLSAWATGYFSTERQSLRNEIGSLTLTRDQLAAANEETQKKIDDAYIRLKFVSAEARYALGHLRGMEQPSAESVARIRAALKDLPEQPASDIRGMLDREELTRTIVEITETELEELHKSVESITASAWAVALQPQPMGSLVANRRILLAPDGRFYDADDKSFREPEVGGR